MKIDKRYLVLIIILIAAIGAVVWTFLTNPKAKSLLNPGSESALEDNVMDQESVADAVSGKTSDAADGEDQSVAEGKEGSSGADEQEDAENQSDVVDESDGSDDSAQDADAVNAAAEQMIIDNGGELVIIVPDGEDTFGE